MKLTLNSIVLLVTMAAGAAEATAGTITGSVARVIDGDTFVLCTKPNFLGRAFGYRSACLRIRVCGIDAPEANDPGGPEATQAMNELIAHKDLRCIPVGEGSVCDGKSRPTSYERLVAQCYLGDLDIADEMVRTGHACDWLRYSGGHYSKAPGRVRCAK